ncbi:MAG: 2-dehydro-3-deoxyphosphogluconate aldolase [Candidatus Hydrogenedentota bacterium]|nr:MAG: 2-dehydro-3-deoxyphosphogluconate aldolase [Candidatus Hydrogenedentota bacterium]
MQTRKEIRDQILDCGVVAIVRLSDGDQLREVAEAIYAGGVTAMEFTLNTPKALESIRECNREMTECVIGAGTVLNAKAAQTALEAGAQFIVSPGTKADVIEVTHHFGKVAVPGAYTPTEIGVAMDLYADIIKLFPAKGLGPAYVKEIRGPYDDVCIMPTGGVTPENVADYMEAGAAAVASGGGLVNDALVQSGAFDTITANAQAMKAAMDAARKENG